MAHRLLPAVGLLALLVVPACLEGGVRVSESLPDTVDDTPVTETVGDTTTPPPDVVSIPDTPKPDVPPVIDVPAPHDGTVMSCSAGAKRCGDDGITIWLCNSAGTAWTPADTCAGGSVCKQGFCVSPCAPECGGKQCGPDGCGGQCGFCDDEATCTPDGTCVCIPNCDGQECGFDGCGGICGICVDGSSCVDGVCSGCAPQCQGKACGPDGCGGACGDCGPQGLCLGTQCLCIPECQDKQCGSDGCGGLCGTCAAGESCDDTGSCQGQPDVYRAVYVEDNWDGDCSPYNSSGADIRGARLRTPSNQQIGFWVSVNAEPGTTGCQNNYTDPDDVVGQPGNDYVALQGGWIAGTFPNSPPIEQGMRIRVFELDGQAGGSAESYKVYLATDIDCPYQPDAKNTCMKLLTDSADGTTNIIVP